MTENNDTNTGETTRQEFGAMVRTRSAELASTQAAASAKAAIEARFIVAMQRPSDPMIVRSKLLKDCERKAFADSAWFAKPIGGGKSAEGPSVRFAEAFMRARGNMVPEVRVIVDDEDRRVLRVEVLDLESNVTLAREVAIAKTVERSSGDGREVLGVRKNSQGRTTYTVRASEDDLATKEASAVSKALRTLILRLCPGDLLDEAERCIRATRKRGAENADERKIIVDDFEVQLGVSPAQLAEYLGHPLDVITPDEIVDLRKVWTSIRDGEARWADFRRHAEPVERTDQPARLLAGKAAILAAAREQIAGDVRAIANGEEVKP